MNPRNPKPPSIKRDKDGQYPMTLEQKINSAKSFEPVYMIATKATHKLGDLSREYQQMSSENLCQVSKEVDDFYIGCWITGFGFFNVQFPKETTRPLTAEEKEYFNKMNFAINDNPSFKLNID